MRHLMSVVCLGFCAGTSEQVGSQTPATARASGGVFMTKKRVKENNPSK